MLKRFVLHAAWFGLILGFPAFAAGNGNGPPTGAQSSVKKPSAGSQIYGSQLMTPQERDAYRAKMRSARTQAERDQIRSEHHTEMQQRAKEKGVTLPDQPRGPGGAGAGGPGKGPGPGGPNR